MRVMSLPCLLLTSGLLSSVPACSSADTKGDGGGATSAGGAANGGVPAQAGGTSSQGGSAAGSPAHGGATGGSPSASGGASTGGAAGASGGALATGGSASGSSGVGAGGTPSAGAAGSAGTATGGATAGGAGNTGAGGNAVAGMAGAPAGGAAGQSGAPLHRELILYNDANGGQLLYVNSASPAMGWQVNSGTGRDLQLVGNGRVMLGKAGGWDEYQLSNGMRVGGVSSLAGTQTAHRLAADTTLVASVSGGAIVLRMANAAGAEQRRITYPGYTYVRCVRPTKTGTFLVTADTKVFEGNAAGDVLWEVTVPGTARHVWKALRLPNGNTVVATGYDKSLRIYDPQETLLQTITAPATVYPQLFADFRVMPSGNYFVVNSQADRTEDRSIQLLEFSPTGVLVWQQKQPAGVDSLEAAIVLDGVDTSKLHVETEGTLVPLP